MAAVGGDGLEKLEDMIVRAAEASADHVRAAKAAIGNVIFGQDAVIDQALITILCGGHGLLVGVPGLAKTKLVETMGIALGLDAKRIQFTPDLMPSDILGTEVLEESQAGKRSFRFIPGPVFTQLLMADEINRASPRTQSALLQAMQEQHVTVAGTRHDLPRPFHVLATQNPIEQEGTYPLPEAQQDRFMFNILVDYPEEEEEFKIVEMTTAVHAPAVERVLSATDIQEMQDIVRKVPVAPYVIRYAMKFTRLTRKEKGQVPGFIKDYVTWGAGPRATQFLVMGAKARAVLHGRYYVSCEDIRAVAVPVLRHRIITNFNAEAEGLKPDDLIERMIKSVPVDEHESEQSGKLPKIFRSANVG
jgi:MoxR-like ATPase